MRAGGKLRPRQHNAHVIAWQLRRTFARYAETAGAPGASPRKEEAASVAAAAQVDREELPMKGRASMSCAAPADNQEPFLSPYSKRSSRLTMRSSERS